MIDAPISTAQVALTFVSGVVATIEAAGIPDEDFRKVVLAFFAQYEGREPGKLREQLARITAVVDQLDAENPGWRGRNQGTES